MKPHEIIEIIGKTTCRAYTLSIARIYRKGEMLQTNNDESKRIREAKIIISCMVSKYLGDEYVFDVLSVPPSIMGAYKTAHRQYMASNRNSRVYDITTSIMKQLSVLKHTPAHRLEVKHKTWHDPIKQIA